MWRKNRLLQSAPLAVPGVMLAAGIVVGDSLGDVRLWWALLVLTLVVSLVRFYQGMYSSEGYLSHTLPVTPTRFLAS